MNCSIGLIEQLEGRMLLSSVATPNAFASIFARPTLSAANTLQTVKAAATSSPSGFTPAMIAKAYGIDQIKFGSTVGNGAGQTIAIIDAFNDPNIIGDLAHFDAQFSLPDTTTTQVASMLTVVNQTGGSTLPGVDNTGGSWEIEESLDVEWAHVVAPAAKLLLVECNSGNFSDTIQAGVDYARKAPGVTVVSMSFAGSDQPAELPLDSYFTTPSGHAGVTFVAATGDGGQLAGYPALSPNVVGAGGTSLALADSSGTYGSESAFSDDTGGVSSYELQPGYQNQLVTQESAFRAGPDVSFDGNKDTGVSIYDSYDGGAATPWLTEAGTSLASPAWAGLFAITDQGRAIAKQPSLDGATQTLPRLYNLPASDFHDVTTGSDDFNAGPGFDLATGRGTPVANKLVVDLTRNPVGPSVTGNSATFAQSGWTTSVSSVTFQFSTSINPATFSIASDVDSFTGPGNTNLKSRITGAQWSNSDKTLQISFSRINSNGLYRMTIGPNIGSSTAPKMDQNFNGVAGESSDTYTAHFTITNSAGPDSYGYSATPYPYQTLSLTPGAAGVSDILDNTDDDSTGISLGSNTFNFYGVTYTGASLYVDSNGFITFNQAPGAGTLFANGDLAGTPSSAMIAPLWDDWSTNKSTASHVLYEFANPNSTGTPQELVIEWHQVTNQGAVFMGSKTPATFQLIMQLNTGSTPGSIIFNYPNLNVNETNFNNGGSATVGIRNASSSGGQVLLASIDDPSGRRVASGKAIRVATGNIFTPGPATTEGKSAMFSLGSFTDTHKGPFNVSVNWGDGSALSHFTVASAGSLGSLAHTYKKTGIFNTAVSISGSGESLSQRVAFPVVVGDALLTGSANSISAVTGATFTGIVASFTDADPGAVVSDYKATITWGDGQISTGSLAHVSGTTFSVTGAHKYAKSGTFAITIKITDVGGSALSVNGKANIT